MRGKTNKQMKKQRNTVADADYFYSSDRKLNYFGKPSSASIDSLRIFNQQPF